MVRYAAPDLEAFATKLFYMLDLGRREGVAETLEEAGKALVAYDSSETAIKTGLAKVLSVALSKLAALHQCVDIQEYAPLLAELYQHAHYDRVMSAAYSQLAELAGRLGANGNLPVVKQVMDFIQRHYHENLKLETLAEMYNYNKGYLGRMFKQHTGDSFHTFLDKVRIQQAIRLLREGYKVYEVSELVGYPNVDYFHSKFKKYVAASPSSIKGLLPRPRHFHWKHHRFLKWGDFMKASTGIVTCLLMIGALLAASGCSNGSDSDSSGSPDASPNKELAPMTITYAAGDNNPLWDGMQSDVGKLITEKTGISMKAQFPISVNDTDMFALMVANNEYPDIVSAKGSVGKLKDAGALIDLTPLIEEHAPNIKKVYLLLL
ncbi:helix-turn-helix domain-containing protein [Paenibacillus sp. FSL H8-0457]|uniref:AraC family transcriptional regulator n=1 Tax=unclassified Paenibacillus TaxID=185978 RepID=UPI0003112411|nr:MULTISPECIES: helix-turn-helix domain-containing protein [unclassified Paenibacillus]ETT62845.1 AraC family transcriptional regulator [Paenibacillus sp. FSL H8-457]